MEESSASGDQIELISFEIADQSFCIDIRHVREIRCWSPATPIPHAPPAILGVINLRGSVMAVVDLRSHLGLGRTEPTSRHVIVVIQDGDRVAGVLVDAVQETFQTRASLLQPPPSTGDPSSMTFVDALLPLEGRMMSRLVVASLLPPETRLAA